MRVAMLFYQRYKERNAWREKNFLTVTQGALYSVPDSQSGRLEKRTLFECDLRSLLLHNDTAVKKVLEAASVTKADDPLLVANIPQEDRWHLLNAVLNKLSSLYPDGHIYADMQFPVLQAWYLFTLVFERYNEASSGRSFCHQPADATADVRSTKIRVFVVAEDTVRALLRGDLEAPRTFQNRRHEMRWRTLQHVAQRYKEQQNGGMQVLLRLHITLPNRLSDEPFTRHPHSTHRHHRFEHSFYPPGDRDEVRQEELETRKGGDEYVGRNFYPAPFEDKNPAPFQTRPPAVSPRAHQEHNALTPKLVPVQPASQLQEYATGSAHKPPPLVSSSHSTSGNLQPPSSGLLRAKSLGSWNFLHEAQCN